MAEGAGRKPKYATGKELSVVSSHVAMLAEYDAALDNPSELIRTHGMSKIDDMRQDDTIHGIERGLIKTVLKRPGKYVPAEDDAKDDRQHAAFLNWCVTNMEGSLKKALEEIALAYAYGFTPTERILDSGSTPFGDRIYLKALKTRKPHDFAVHVDKHGNIKPKGLYQTVGGQEIGYDLTVGDGGGFILYSYDKEFSNHLGNTAFGPAYRSYFCKDWFIKFQSIGIERFANGIPEIKIDLDATSEDYATSQAKAEDILKGLQTGSYIIMPSGFTLDIHELQGAGLSYIKDAILLHSGMIATALLVPEQAGFTQVEGGSYAKAESQMGLWMSVVEEMQEDLCEDVLGDQLGRVLIDLNHGPQEHYPTYEYESLDEDDKFEWCTSVADAIKGKAITHWTLEREEALCAKLGLPMLPEDIKKILTDAETLTIGKPVGGGGADGSGGGGSAPDEDEAEDAGTPDAMKMSEAFPADVFQMADGRTKSRARDDVENSAIDALSGVAKEIRDDLIARTEKILAMGEGKGNQYISKKLRLKKAGDIRRVIHAMLLMATLQGKKDVREFIRSSKHTDIKLAETVKLAELSSLALIPKEVRAYFKGIPLAGSEAAVLANRAFDVAGGLTNQMLKEVQQVLYDGLKHGDPRKTRMELRRIFKGYLDTGELRDDVLLHPWRIETIARNNTRDAYARGRLRQLEDPDVADMVVAYANTVIYDENTSDTCETGMEGPFDKDDYVPPPYHHACRTEGPIPIFEGERHEKHTFPHDAVAEGFDN